MKNKICYFAYGSNLNVDQIKERCKSFRLVGKSILKRYKLEFGGFSDKWDCGTANIVLDENEEVWGIIYELTENALMDLDYCEGNYDRVGVSVFNNFKKLNAFTYQLKNKNDKSNPSNMYLSIMIDAARKFSFPKYYINRLINFRV